MNRDEKDCLIIHKNMAYPCDKKSCGTWFGVNDSGITIALLNRYDIPNKPSSLSRGRFIPLLLKSQKMEEIIPYFLKIHQKKDNPFNLIAISQEKIINIKWNGYELEINEHNSMNPLFFTSSSEHEKESKNHRQLEFKSFVEKNKHSLIAPNMIWNDLHLNKKQNHQKLSILMQRDFTHTKSITQSIINEQGIVIFYKPLIINNRNNLNIKMTHMF